MTYEEAFAPYARALKRIKLPRRYRMGDPRNIRRTMAVCDEMRRVRERLKRRAKNA